MTVWRRYRLKDICTYIGSGTTPKSSNSKYYDKGTYNWINTGDLNNGVVSSSKQQISDFALKDYPTLRFYPKGTIIEAMYGATIGKAGMLGMDATVNQACCAMVIDRNKAIPNFVLYYLVYYKPQLIKESFGGTQPNVNQFKVSNIAICIPPLESQQKIITYLDTKLSEIDHQVSILTSKRDAYLRLKKSIINHAVTRGLDLNAKMKDSGIEWIGEVPEHWEVKRMKDIFFERKELSLTGEEDLLSVSEFYGVARRKDKMNSDEEFESRADSLVGYKICKAHDLVINIMLAWKTGLGISDNDGIVSPAYAVYEGRNIASHFYHYLLRSGMYVKEFKRHSKGIIDSRLRLYNDRFNNISAIYPPLPEQRAIATYLDDKCAKIDTIVSNLDKQISRYADLKRSLIDEVITGKRAV